MTQSIRWTDDERETVYRGVRAVANELGLGFEHLNVDDASKLLRRGQYLLPENRRREVRRNNVQRDLARVIQQCMTPEQIAKRTQVMAEKARAEELAEMPKESVIKPSPVVVTPKPPAKKKTSPAPAPAVAPEPIKDPVDLTVKPPQQPETMADMVTKVISSITSSLSDEIAIKVADLIVDKVADRVVAKMAEKQAHDRKSKKLPKILVIGPLKKQQQQLIDSVAGVAELKFVSSEDGSAMVSTRSGSCTGAVLWTSFVDHSTDSAARKAMGTYPLRRVSGGLGKVQASIEELALEMSV